MPVQQKTGGGLLFLASGNTAASEHAAQKANWNMGAPDPASFIRTCGH